MRACGIESSSPSHDLGCATNQILRRAPPRCTTPHSHAEDAFAAAPLRDAVIAAMERQLASGRQVGIAVAVYHHGQEICHVCGGVFRAAGSGWERAWTPVDGDTLFMGYSIVKGVAATCLMSSVDRGEVSYQQPVSAVWPAFAARGKGAVTVADAVSHRAGAKHRGATTLNPLEILNPKPKL